VRELRQAGDRPPQGGRVIRRGALDDAWLKVSEQHDFVARIERRVGHRG
jgi:hypothetical protein